MGRDGERSRTSDTSARESASKTTTCGGRYGERWGEIPHLGHFGAGERLEDDDLRGEIWGEMGRDPAPRTLRRGRAPRRRRPAGGDVGRDGERSRTSDTSARESASKTTTCGGRCGER